MASDTDDAFSQEVTRLRANYESKRQRSNLFPPAGQSVLDMGFVPGERPSMGLWYDDGTELGRYVRLFDLPGTLSIDILRLERNLPPAQGRLEIEGGLIRSLDTCPALPEPIEDDSEDIGDLLAQLPLVEVDPSQHFLKNGKCRSEIENLLRCQAGHVPGSLSPPHHLPPR